MRYMELPVRVEGSQDYARLETYLLDTPTEKIKIQKRPMIVICPGGAYEKVSFREGEPLAVHFLNQGYHACVLRYSVVPSRYPTALLELATAMKMICEHADDWQVDTEHIILQGSSAGGHLAACLGAFWNRGWISDELDMPKEWLRAAGILLSYPVITSREGLLNQKSFENLLGERFLELREELSLENQVTKEMPLCFMWHTLDDNTVPVENSFLLATALKNAGVAAELHVFPKGAHGLGLASPLVERPDESGVNEHCAQWIALADAWIKTIV